MKTPWGFLLAMPMLMVMCLISIGAVLQANEGDLFDQIAYPVLAIAAVWYAIRAMMRDTLAQERAVHPHRLTTHQNPPSPTP